MGNHSGPEVPVLGSHGPQEVIHRPVNFQQKDLDTRQLRSMGSAEIRHLIHPQVSVA
jgi:hypothetical protein